MYNYSCTNSQLFRYFSQASYVLCFESLANINSRNHIVQNCVQITVQINWVTGGIYIDMFPVSQSNIQIYICSTNSIRTVWRSYIFCLDVSLFAPHPLQKRYQRVGRSLCLLQLKLHNIESKLICTILGKYEYLNLHNYVKIQYT